MFTTFRRSVTNFAYIFPQDNSRLKVDLRKAQTACSDLTDQLTKSETDATNFKEQLTSVTEELNDAREAKDQALKVPVF